MVGLIVEISSSGKANTSTDYITLVYLCDLRGFQYDRR